MRAATSIIRTSAECGAAGECVVLHCAGLSQNLALRSMGASLLERRFSPVAAAMSQRLRLRCCLLKALQLRQQHNSAGQIPRTQLACK